MPYFISDTRSDCKSGWATVNAEGATITCHETKEHAVKHMVALAVATGEKAGGSWETRDDG